jgi:murein DD-endopeptidase MepM/ murein hydrolase activator NlpD
VRVIAAILVASFLVLPAVPAGAAQGDLDRARQSANKAAADLASAQSRLSELQGDILDLQARREETAARLGHMEGAVRELAIGEFVRGRTRAPELDLDLDVSAATRRAVLAGFVAQGAGDSIDEFRSLSEDLERTERQLAERKQQESSAVSLLRARVAAAEAELDKLQRLEAERKAREAAQRAAAAAAARRASTARTVAVSGSWTCPVQGPRAFSNDWGDPRGGGRRRHQGNDILAPRGTPVVASVSGTVRRKDSGAGGISYYLTGDDGNEYYGAHLSSYAGITGRVSQGTVIGYVGNTGNARGGPNHLHFEIHPGGGSPVNPYNTLRQYC